MLSLHNTTELTKQLIKWGAIGLVILVALLFILRQTINLAKLLFPKDTGPTTQFGKLPKIPFTDSKFSNASQYTLDTISGSLPVFQDQAKVQKISQSQPNLLSLQRAKDRLSQVGFSSEPSSQSQSLYSWQETNPPFRKISMNIIDFNFTLTSDVESDPVILSAKNLPNEQKALQIVKDFLSSLSSFPDDVDIQKAKITLLKRENYTFVLASSFSNAQFIQVDLHQNAIDNLEIYYPTAPASLMQLVVAGGELKPQVISGSFYYQKIDPGFSTYPLKTTQEAFLELQQGSSFIVQNTSGNQPVIIKNVVLGYFIGEKKQEYLMPVFVFEGNGFLSFVSAVRNEWITQ